MVPWQPCQFCFKCSESTQLSTVPSNWKILINCETCVKEKWWCREECQRDAQKEGPVHRYRWPKDCSKANQETRPKFYSKSGVLPITQTSNEPESESITRNETSTSNYSSNCSKWFLSYELRWGRSSKKRSRSPINDQS